MLIFVDIRFLPDLFEESAKPKLRAWVQDVDAVGKEPGLAFWDAHNEPDLVRIPSVPPNTDPASAYGCRQIRGEHAERTGPGYAR